MKTRLAPPLAGTPLGDVAETALRACVHCGMCNATCPTYQLTGDELDGPRGRIYLMKQVLEGATPTRLTLDHLDSCLTCRACETTCPSSVEYHHLLDIGRAAVSEAVSRPASERFQREAIRRLTLSPRLFSALAAAGRLAAFALPKPLKDKLPPKAEAGYRPATIHPRTMLLLTGCVQSAVARHFNATTARVFDRLGVTLIEAPQVMCCGSVSHHLDAPDAAKAQARANLDAWIPLIDAGAEALIVNSSGCAAHIADYPSLLADDPAYAPLAARMAALLRDPIQILSSAQMNPVRPPPNPRVVIHEPCTLQHGLKLTGQIPDLLTRLGYEVLPTADGHLCCGSAGAYSLLQPKMAGRLRETKLQSLNALDPTAIYTANIGCWMHLSGGTPVRHWIEAVDGVL